MERIENVSRDGITHLSVFGDSLITIQHCIEWSKHVVFYLSPTMQRIILILDKFEFIELFHIKREHKKVVDEQANKAVIQE